MAISKIIFHVLDVGQGTGNLITMYNTSGKMVKAMLMDLGSKGGGKEDAGVPAVAYTVARLNEMDDPTLDVLFLSHSDSDHVNLLQDLLEAFTPVSDGQVNPLEITKAYYGGDADRYYKKRARKEREFNTLGEVRRYRPVGTTDNITSLAPCETSFGKTGATPMWSEDGVECYLLMGNAAQEGIVKKKKKKKKDVQALGKRKRGSRTDAYAVNSNSLVISLAFADHQFVAMGDATGLTIYRMNKAITKQMYNDYLNRIEMLTMPHHSSRTTTLTLKYVEEKLGKNAAVENIETFAERIDPQTITASSERNGSFKHPSALVMQYFWTRLISKPYYKDPKLEDEQHFFTANFRYEDKFEVKFQKTKKPQRWPTYTQWYTVRTADNIYTNLYYIPDREEGIVIPPSESVKEEKYNPKKDGKRPKGVAWLYDLTAKGKITLEQFSYRKDLWRLQEAIDTGVPPEYWPIPDLRQPDGAALLAGRPFVPTVVAPVEPSTVQTASSRIKPTWKSATLPGESGQRRLARLKILS